MDRLFLDKRFLIVDNRVRIGNIEIDTNIGKNHKRNIVFTVERKNRFNLIKTLLEKRSNFITESVVGLVTLLGQRFWIITVNKGK